MRRLRGEGLLFGLANVHFRCWRELVGRRRAPGSVRHAGFEGGGEVFALAELAKFYDAMAPQLCSGSESGSVLCRSVLVHLPPC